MNRIKKAIIFTVAAALFCFTFAPEARCQSVTEFGVTELGDAFNNFSNASAYLLPAFVLGVTLVKKDKDGTYQFVESASAAMGTTLIL